MITIDDKLFITKEINAIVVSYAQGMVLRKLLMEICFDAKGNNYVVTDLIQSINFYGMDSKPPEVQLELSERLWNFTENLKNEELSALYFWVLNRKYFIFMDEFECYEDGFKPEGFNRKFGRELAYKIYEPSASNLKEDTVQELNLYLCTFATELDLSLIDEHSSEQILEEIDNYCL